jgi:hypothetical protein
VQPTGNSLLFTRLILAATDQDGRGCRPQDRMLAWAAGRGARVREGRDQRAARALASRPRRIPHRLRARFVGIESRRLRTDTRRDLRGSQGFDMRMEFVNRAQPILPCSGLRKRHRGDDVFWVQHKIFIFGLCILENGRSNSCGG